ncbi:hypothetical protein OOK58_01870 [Streptomyces sp. NBC_01728]|uniref:hypothetical protein n=1 Tax=unclassified Streptomyces TaxID=2593676 RepID=UPI00225B1E0D|nr:MULTISPECIES: hypothetical protein [unclassified Streptomyces]MCX4461441.1 hypothetical protein [Streptomyces sp. NBC_01719]MCX4490349.1 hypothetical protein [Streptomyces sp. NBC_01728]
MLPLTSGAVRRRLAAAVWWSALAWPVLALALTPVLLWWLDMGLDELTTPEGAAGVMPTAVAVAYIAWQAAQAVRSEQRTIADKAREIDFAAALPDNQVQLSRAAHDFGTALLSACSPFNTRLLPREAAARAARHISREEAEGLKTETAQFVQGLARMAP